MLPPFDRVHQQIVVLSDLIAVDLGEIRRPSDLLQDPAISTAATVRARAPARIAPHARAPSQARATEAQATPT
jgi:hypothetical protein